MSEDLKNHTDRFARQGYLALAPNLFHWGGKFKCIRAVFKELAAREGRAFADVEAAREWLAPGRQWTFLRTCYYVRRMAMDITQDIKAAMAVSKAMASP